MVNKFEASLEKLHAMLNFIKAQASQNGFDQKALQRIELAAEEVLVNIIQYGYPNGNGTIEIDCEKVTDAGIKIVIKDHGIPFNPLENKPEFDSDAPLEERKVGGCGIFFITNLMDEVKYDRLEDENVLTLVKYKISS